MRSLRVRHMYQYIRLLVRVVWTVRGFLANSGRYGISDVVSLYYQSDGRLSRTTKRRSLRHFRHLWPCKEPAQVEDCGLTLHMYLVAQYTVVMLWSVYNFYYPSPLLSACHATVFGPHRCTPKSFSACTRPTTTWDTLESRQRVGMNSLHFLSRHLDGQFAGHAATPPSTPTGDAMNELLRDDTTRLPRAKSYARIAPRKLLDPRAHQSHAYDRTTPWGLLPQQHFQKRSFSAPALWSFRKTSSPTPVLTPAPQPASPNGPPSTYFPQMEEPCPIPEHIERAHVPLRVLRAIWKAIYSLWLILCGLLLIRRPAQSGKRKEKRGGEHNEESVEEIEESEDDVLVARAPKRSHTSPSRDTDVRFGDAASASDSYLAFSFSGRTTPAPLLEAEVHAVRKRKGTPQIDFTPPTPKVTQAMFATGITMTTIMTETMTITESPEPSSHSSSAPSSQLLPNPIGSSLLTGAAVPVAITPVSTPPPKKTPGLHRQKTLVLDLDETLIHSTSRPMHAHTGGGNLFNIPGLGFIFGNKRGARASGHMVEVVLGGRSTLYHVYKRPFVDYFLRKVCFPLSCGVEKVLTRMVA